uniref:RRM domain-containing protein n=1 Tax=Trieres chinensis TaxID=1514140 RepID=A0A7S1Z4Z8_TRICV|mmetsp:Transcript_17659/g.36047  ORF Transcript_17659/g.36047 Transcript_17659/m.36047 type:complete len:235 (+) Transcript_17659:224-928(+)|eukprot:CAMPEP_0183328308 /NCGR_PEP_ID=MMETSP0160_2-20130417/84214_1 /TAXON_ID=2839 ORGANISM="Odontella Sinensis, Strain Grunow 1884" /NCGR_SAMPLE_ID=MMETSP0160_2 /ASSEMBLY_ACC=CAM_ASM_000250 /LENGTH=234 /DNA_ID=CAMNT_0025496467 /DNA_START=208 /DNA_END=912 /DNA_ORIENTATION=+
MKLSTSIILASACASAAAFAPLTAPPVVVTTTPAGQTTSVRMSAVEETSSSSSSSASSVDVASGARQKMYGKDLAMPGTYVQCGRCHAAYAIQEDDLGDRGKGRRVECSVCGHSWYQSRDRLFGLSTGFEYRPFPQSDVVRVKSNLEAGRPADFRGVAKFYVGNLDYGTDEESVRVHFETAGTVGDVSLITDEDGRSRGFAFVTMMTEEDGEKAVQLDGTELAGRNISVRPPNN